LGEKCRYDAKDNKDEALLAQLQDHRLIPFCPEAYAFGIPRPTMDLVKTDDGNRAISNETGEDLSLAIEHYAKNFFDTHKEIDVYIGKDRSPSCGVCTARVYDEHGELLSSTQAGLMTKEALKRGILSIDARQYEGVQ